MIDSLQQSNKDVLASQQQLFSDDEDKDGRMEEVEKENREQQVIIEELRTALQRVEEDAAR